MSTFFVLPTRKTVGQQFAGYLARLFPGLDWSQIPILDLAELLIEIAELHPDAYLVPREDLPAGEDLATALADGYGAEPGDIIIELNESFQPLLRHEFQEAA